MCASLALFACLLLPQDVEEFRRPVQPVATFSIVARDPDTGQLGVAVQSHWFSVGSVVTWAEAGVGAVATQSFARAAYGPELLEDLRNGKDPSEALAARIEADPGRNVRQVAVVDAAGNRDKITTRWEVSFAKPVVRLISPVTKDKDTWRVEAGPWDVSATVEDPNTIMEVTATIRLLSDPDGAKPCPLERSPGGSWGLRQLPNGDRPVVDHTT